MGKTDPGRHDGLLFGLIESLRLDPDAEFERLRAAPPAPRENPTDAEGADYALRLAADVFAEVRRWHASNGPASASPETLRTAERLLRAADHLKWHASNHGRPGPLGLTLRVTHQHIAELRDVLWIFRLRRAGAERAVGTCRERDEGLAQRRPKRIEIDRDKLREAWGRALQMRPHADKESLRRDEAERLGTSSGTIKRRLQEHGIDPPEKKSDK